MTRTTWTEAEIGAFMRGALDGPDADRIAAALESDPAAQAAAERLEAGATAAPEADALLREAFAAPMRETAPPALMAAVLGAPGKVAAFPARRRIATWASAAMAASLALVVGIGAGFSLRPDAPQTATLSVGAVDGARVAAFEGAPSGSVADGVRLTASFRDAAGQACREFETLDAGGVASGGGVACRAGDAWRVLMLAAAPRPADGAGSDFAPASGAAIDPLGAYLDAIGAGPALSPAEEAAALAKGWR